MTTSGLFAGNVAFYERYRLGYPDRLLRRVASLAGLTPGDRVLDLGTGTGMLAIPFARMAMNVTALDPEPAMLAAAKSAADAAGATVDFREAGSHDLTSDMGPFKLAVLGRSFHWMDRAATLDMLDRIVAPGGSIALLHDAHPPLEENRWFKTLCDIARKFGRGGKHYASEGHSSIEDKGGHRRYEPYLFASAFTELDWLSVTIRRPLMVEDIIGRAFSMSTCSPGLLGDRQKAFADRLRAALHDLSPDGTFTEVAELVALVAKRPD